MEKEEKEFIEALSGLARNLKELKEEIEKEFADDSAEEVETRKADEKTFTLSEIEAIIEEASEKTEKDLEEMMKSDSVPSMLLRLQNIAVMGIFRTNIAERIDEHE